MARKIYENDLFKKEQKLVPILREICETSRFPLSDEYIQHGTTTTLEHSIAVAWVSLRIAHRLHLRVNEESLIRGALLHDYFLYDWHEKNAGHRMHGFHHPATALRNARHDFRLNPMECDIIVKHMFPLTFKAPSYRESRIVCIADKICSTVETLCLCRRIACYRQGKKTYSFIMAAR